MIPRIESITNKSESRLRSLKNTLLTCTHDLVFPIFMKHATQLVADGQKPGGVDFFAYTHHSIAESMLTVVMGQVRTPIFF